MRNRSVLVGVDGTPEAAHAARVGEWIATRLGADCQLVHGMAEAWATVPPPDASLAGIPAIAEQTVANMRTLLQAGLEGQVAPSIAAGIQVEPGRGAAVLTTAARRLQAELIIVGGKLHAGWKRLLGSTATDLLRLTDVPVLVTRRPQIGIARILVATDLSHVAGPTIRVAQQWATQFGASLRLLHVAESMPSPGQGMPRDAEAYASASERVRAELMPFLHLQTTSVVIRPGRTTAVIATEASQWKADLLVLGSHGKGFIDRLLLGSTSEQLVRMLVAPTLVVPAVPIPSAQGVPVMAASGA